MRKLLLIAIAVCALGAGTYAAEPRAKHEFRLGAGDMLFETLIWHDQLHKTYESGAGSAFPEKRDYRYTPHFSGEYSYHILPWMSLGAMLDLQVTNWNTYNYNGQNKLAWVDESRFWNFCIMPVIRFNYLRADHVGLYSSLAAGMDLNGGTEKDGFGRNVQVGAALDIRLIGVRVGGGHWWGYAELGGLFALRNPQCMYMLGSSLGRVGVSYKF